MTRFARQIATGSLFALTLLVATSAQAGELEDKAAVMIKEAIEVAAKGDFDTWVERFCDPERCHTPQSIEQWKAYQLKQLKIQGAACLTNGKVQVVRWRGSLSEGTHKAKAYVQCSNRQLPPPVELRWDEATKKLYIRNTSI